MLIFFSKLLIVFTLIVFKYLTPLQTSSDLNKHHIVVLEGYSAYLGCRHLSVRLFMCVMRIQGQGALKCRWNLLLRSGLL